MGDQLGQPVARAIGQHEVVQPDRRRQPARQPGEVVARMRAEHRADIGQRRCRGPARERKSPPCRRHRRCSTRPSASGPRGQPRRRRWRGWPRSAAPAASSVARGAAPERPGRGPASRVQVRCRRPRTPARRRRAARRQGRAPRTGARDRAAAAAGRPRRSAAPPPPACRSGRPPHLAPQADRQRAGFGRHVRANRDEGGGPLGDAGEPRGQRRDDRRLGALPGQELEVGRRQPQRGVRVRHRPEQPGGDETVPVRDRQRDLHAE